MATCSDQIISKYFEAYTHVDGLTLEPRVYKARIKVIRRNGHDVFITRDNRKEWEFKVVDRGLYWKLRDRYINRLLMKLWNERYRRNRMNCSS